MKHCQLNWPVCTPCFCIDVAFNANVVHVVNFPGFRCTSQLVNYIEQCEPGQYSPAGTLVCLDCPAGSFCNDSSALPSPCPSGFISSAGSFTCAACPEGHRCPDADSAPIPCIMGTYALPAATVCDTCTDGFPCPAAGNISAPTDAVCPVGGFCKPAGAFTLCPAGKYGYKVGGVSLVDACTTCEAGTCSRNCMPTPSSLARHTPVFRLPLLPPFTHKIDSNHRSIHLSLLNTFHALC